MPKRRALVIGAGVVGLSTAVRLQEAGYDVSVVAREFPGAAETMDGRRQIDYTSAWGGAHNRWIPPAAGETGPEAQVSRRDHGFALATYGHMNATARAHPEAGITFMRGIEYLEEGVGAPTLAAAYMGLEGFRRLPEEELPADVRWGCEYRTWCVNPMVYCCFLLRRFVLGGGRCRRGDVSRGDVSRGDDGVLRLDADADADPAAAESEPPAVVVNCSGYGLGDDDSMFVTRGQTCLVANACDVTITRQNADGTWTFCVPRGFDGGTVVGGTKELDNWDPEPSPAVRDQLLRRFAATYPRILDPAAATAPGYTVIRDIVGRRPTRRGGMRLEREEKQTTLLSGSSPCSVLLVHAYGLGGRGFELSWGVAGRAVELCEV